MNRQRSVEEIAAALARPEPPQPQAGKDGDPQLAALHQCLLHHSGLGSSDAILDIGSGNGVLATVISNIWTDISHTPKYIAVDVPQQLDSLSLPSRIHNNSQKMPFDEFMKNGASNIANSVKLVVIRNVFHELDIKLTAKLVSHINLSFSPGTIVYIQEMTTLPNPERSNAGWHSNLFSTFLEEIGLRPNKGDLTSRTGIKWFSIQFETNGKNIPIEESAFSCAKQRKEQKKIMHETLRDLNSDYSREGSTADVIYTSLEIASIDAQLGAFETEFGTLEKKEVPTIVGQQVPLRPATENQLFSFGDSNTLSAFGLVAVLRDKDDADIPRLISTSEKNVFFSGYSLKLMFRLPDNRNAIREAARRGVRQRFLIVDPSADDIVSSRSRHPVYNSHDDLINDIRKTIEEFLEFITADSLLMAAFGDGLISLGMTNTTPSCSFFIIDKLCFVSIYTSRLTGTSAPCLIFSAAADGYSGYFEILQEEFREMFENSTKVTV